MKIKEQSEQRMVLTPGLSMRLVWIWFGMSGTFFWLDFRFAPEFFPIAFALYIMICLALGLHALGEVISHKIIIDKLTGCITVREQHFLFVRRQRFIQFSAVKYVGLIEHTRKFAHGGTGHHTWEVRLYYYGKKGEHSITVDDKENENQMRSLASGINNLIGSRGPSELT